MVCRYVLRREEEEEGWWDMEVKWVCGYDNGINSDMLYRYMLGGEG